MKQLNTEWMSELLKLDKHPQQKENNQSADKIEWLNVNKAYKKSITFKVMPANSKENKIWAYVVGTHWELGPEKMRFVCPEQTLHLRNREVICPVCEAKRRLLKMGFTEEELSKPGKFGPIPVFDPKITSNIKVVALNSDCMEFDKKHISILSQNGSYTARWLVEKYNEPEWPDFLRIDSSNPIKFSRDRDNGKWQREAVFSTVNFMDIEEQLREQNEEITMADLWKMPTDEEILKAKEIANAMVESYVAARDAQKNATDSYGDDSIPF